MAEPVYRSIADAIKADIAANRLVEGDRLPTVRDLAARYDAPIGTVAKALDTLRADGVIVSRHGRGLYVRSFKRILRSSPSRLSQRQWGTGKAIQDADTNGRLRVVHVEVHETPAPEHVAASLSVPVDAAVLTRSRRFAVEDRLVQSAVSYIPLDVVAAAPSIAYTGPGPGGIYARMAEAGFAPARFTERLACRPASVGERNALDLPDATWVMEIIRHAHTGNGRCVEVNVMVLDASAYLLEYQFAAE